jgi:hypothetical protein
MAHVEDGDEALPPAVDMAHVEEGDGGPPAEAVPLNAFDGKKVVPALIEDGFPKYWYKDEGRRLLIKASGCRDENLSAKYLEDKSLKGVLLSLTHSSASKSAQKIYTLGTVYNAASSVATKRQRIISNAPYDRILIFGDLMDPPRCFAIVMHNASESTMYYRQSGRSIGIGTIFYVVHPERSNNVLGLDIPIISSPYMLLPLKPSLGIASIQDNFPSCAISHATQPKEQLFFVEHGVSIELARFRLVTDNVSCSGKFCDRSKVLDKAVACGCLNTSLQVKACVAEYTITYPVPATINPRKWIEINTCRSLRTTQLFFHNLDQFISDNRPEDISHRFDEIRQKVSSMVTYVNNHGGWTVVGWFRKGEVDDASNAGQKMESLDTVLHLSYVMPTSLDIQNSNDNAFEALKIESTAPAEEE